MVNLVPTKVGGVSSTQGDHELHPRSDKPWQSARVFVLIKILRRVKSR